MSDQDALNGTEQPENQPAKDSVPMTRERILEKLAEAARQKAAAGNKAVGSDQTEKTVNIIRTWLSE